ncbi:MAG: 60S ribosomal protein L22 [Promethearchaeota archaeon]
MSEEKNKSLTINVKDLSFKSDQHVVDMVRFLAEALPQIELDRDGNEINVEMPLDLSKRALKLRIKKYLYKKGLNKDFRPIALKTADKEGYTVKEKKIVELSYY